MELSTDIVDGVVYSFTIYLGEEGNPNYLRPSEVILFKGQVGTMSGVLSLLANYTTLDPVQQGGFITDLKERHSNCTVSKVGDTWYRLLVYKN